MEEMKSASEDPRSAALVAALRIFAARGRAIREARERQEKSGVSPSDSVEFESGDLQQTSAALNSEREKVDDTRPQ